jgi:hypothetical protein
VPVIVDRLTGKVRQAEIFVAIMVTSNFTYVEATWTRVAGPIAARLLRRPRARPRCEATIDHKLRTGHVARCVGGEE